MNLLEVKDVEKTYPDGTRALRGVTLSVRAGEMVAVMGPSGSGKSTLLHILGLLDRATKGTYRFKGQRTEAFDGATLAHLRNAGIGFVFQLFNLIANFSVEENVQLPLYYSQVPEREWRTRAHEMLERVGLMHKRNQYPNKLSGGERQRAAIARALVTHPEIILADEPTGNLDSATGAQVMALFQMLHREGKTIVLITHDPTIAAYAERVVHLRDGVVAREAMHRAAAPHTPTP